MYMHAYTLYSAVRPYGATIMLGSWTETAGPKLFCVEPSGTSYGYWGCAAGKAKQAAKTEIEKMNLKDKMFELELSWVTKDTKGIHQRVPNDEAAAAEKFAKEALEDSDDSDDGDMAYN